MGNGWQEFFDGHAPVYMENCFTQNTLSEVEFLTDELHVEPGDHILDVGCGTGRHSVEMARRGFRMTGVDLGAGMLGEARKAASAAGVDVEFIQADAADFRSEPLFDAAVCLCEGAFGLLGPSDDPIQRDLRIVRNIHAGLKPGGRLIATILSAFRIIREITDEDLRSGRFDYLSMTETSRMEWGDQHVDVRERHYVPTEMRLLCELAGFRVESIWGGTAGDWGKTTTSGRIRDDGGR